MRELALQVLDELPDQFIDYMIMKETEPESIYNPPPDQVEVVRLLQKHSKNMSEMEQFTKKLQLQHGGDGVDFSANILSQDDQGGKHYETEKSDSQIYIETVNNEAAHAEINFNNELAKVVIPPLKLHDAIDAQLFD